MRATIRFGSRCKRPFTRTSTLAPAPELDPDDRRREAHRFAVAEERAIEDVACRRAQPGFEPAVPARGSHDEQLPGGASRRDASARRPFRRARRDRARRRRRQRAPARAVDDDVRGRPERDHERKPRADLGDGAACRPRNHLPRSVRRRRSASWTGARTTRRGALRAGGARARGLPRRTGARRRRGARSRRG